MFGYGQLSLRGIKAPIGGKTLNHPSMKWYGGAYRKQINYDRYNECDSWFEIEYSIVSAKYGWCTYGLVYIIECDKVVFPTNV